MNSHSVIAACQRLGNVMLRVIVTLSLILSVSCFASDADEIVRGAQKAYSAHKFDDALKSYRQAAALGNPVALFQLGAMYERGEGIDRNLAEATKWYERAVDAGSAAAAKRLANMYYDGEGVSKDFGRAAALYRRAGELGDSNSFFTLGQIYWIGSDVTRDPEKAVELFTKATQSGNALAMNALGIAYRFGDGVEKSDSAAYAYFKLAQEFGSRLAGENFQKLTTLISDSDRIAGEKLVKQLRSKIAKAPGEMK